MISDMIFKKKVIEKEVVKYQLYLGGEGKKQRQSTKLKGKEALRSKLMSRLSTQSEGLVMERFLGRRWWPSVTNAE